MTAFRDFFRRRRVARHVARHGRVYDFHGCRVEVPDLPEPGVASALLRGKTESREAALIARHLPRELPVVELGGSLGIVSALIRSRLDPATPHLILEADAEIVPTCRRIAAGPRRTFRPIPVSHRWGGGSTARRIRGAAPRAGDTRPQRLVVRLDRPL